MNPPGEIGTGLAFIAVADVLRRSRKGCALTEQARSCDNLSKERCLAVDEALATRSRSYFDRYLLQFRYGTVTTGCPAPYS